MITINIVIIIIIIIIIRIVIVIKQCLNSNNFSSKLRQKNLKTNERTNFNIISEWDKKARAIDSFVYTISCDMIGLSKTKTRWCGWERIEMILFLASFFVASML